MSKSKNKVAPLTKGQRMELVEKSLKNLEMSSRVNQILLKQTGEVISPLQNDLSQTIGRQRELQYRVLALQELLEIKIEDIESKSLELQIKDFDETSDKEDVAKQYATSDIVAENSVIIVSTTTPDLQEDKGILRSKIEYSDIRYPELKENILGKKVSDVFDATVDGVRHEITVLGIRTMPETAKVDIKPAQAQ